MSLEDFKKREQEEFQKSELHAYRVLSLIKDVFKAGETDWGLELLLRSEPILDDEENFNEVPELAELLFDFDKEKAIKWLHRAEKIAIHEENFFKIAKIAAEKALDFEWAARCLKAGYDKTWELLHDDFDNDGLWESPQKRALDSLDGNVWNGPTIDSSSGKIIEWKWNPVPSLDDEQGLILWNHVKPVMKEVYEWWEEELWDDEYNEVLLDNLESDFSEETDWIQRIKEG